MNGVRQLAPYAPPVFPVEEVYSEFQSEGVHLGRAAYVVRLFGCDIAGTWHKDYRPVHLKKLTSIEIIDDMVRVAKPGAFLVLSGGEPTLHRLDPIISEARSVGSRVHIETAGHHPLPKSVDWIMLTPKVFARVPLPENIARANEFKIEVENEASIADTLRVILPFCRERAAIWLQPKWEHRANADILKLITDTVRQNPRLRAGYEVGRLYRELVGV